MNLQITPFGIAILAIVCGAIWLASTPIRRSLKDSRVGRWFVPAVLAAIVGVAIGEEVRIAWQFAKLCEDAGVKVFRKVEVEGFLDETNRSSPTRSLEKLVTDRQAIEEVDRVGYRFKEWFLTDGRVVRRERVAEGIQWSVRETAESRYHYRRHYQPTPNKYEEPVGYKIEKSGELVVDVKTGAVLGSDTRFTRGPSVVEGLWIQFLGQGLTTCRGSAPESLPGRHLLYRYVLLPVTSK